MDERKYLESILQLLDDAGVNWLTDEVRQLRYGMNEESIGSGELEKSRQSYDAGRGEHPFIPIESPLSGRHVEVATDRTCIEFVAVRVESIAEQLKQADLDAAELGVDRIRLGLSADGEHHSSMSTEALRSLAVGIREGLQ